MNTQTLPNLTFAIALTQLAPGQPVQVCSRDYGFDTDEEEIARGMLAPLPASLSSQAVCEVGVDEIGFDSLWFLS